MCPLPCRSSALEWSHLLQQWAAAVSILSGEQMATFTPERQMISRVIRPTRSLSTATAAMKFGLVLLLAGHKCALLLFIQKSLCWIQHLTEKMVCRTHQAAQKPVWKGERGAAHGGHIHHGAQPFPGQECSQRGGICSHKIPAKCWLPPHFCHRCPQQEVLQDCAERTCKLAVQVSVDQVRWSQPEKGHTLVRVLVFE